MCMGKPQGELEIGEVFLRANWAKHVRVGDSVRVEGDQLNVVGEVLEVGSKWIHIEGFKSRFSRTTGKYGGKENIRWYPMQEAIEVAQEQDYTGSFELETNDNGEQHVSLLARSIQQRELLKEQKRLEVSNLIDSVIESGCRDVDLLIDVIKTVNEHLKKG